MLAFTDVGAFLQDFATLAVDIVPGTSTGITARDDGAVLTVASSDDLAELLDETQYRNGAGPCLDAFHSGQVVEVTDVASETRWPSYTAEARRHKKDGMLLDQLEAALESRTVIDQALGVIMSQQRCTAVAAFDVLRRQSQNSNRKLRDVATDLIHHVSGQPPTPGRPFDV